jgi:hypothetical protein
MCAKTATSAVPGLTSRGGRSEGYQSCYRGGAIVRSWLGLYPGLLTSGTDHRGRPATVDFYI